MKKKYLAILICLLLCCMTGFAACTPDGGDGGGGDVDTQLAKVTGFSYDNTGYWNFNEVTGAEEYAIMIQSPEYYLTVPQTDAVGGKFKVSTGSIPAGNHTAMIVAKAAGKTSSTPATCTANVTQAGTTIPLTIKNASYSNATKKVSWDIDANASSYTLTMRRAGLGSYRAVPENQLSAAEGRMEAIISYDLVKVAFTAAGEGNDLSGPLEFKITAQGSTQGLTTYTDGEKIFDSTYAITKLAAPNFSFEQTDKWYTRRVFIFLDKWNGTVYPDYVGQTDIAYVTRFEITLNGKTLEELDIELNLNASENRIEFLYSVDPGGSSVGVYVAIKAISETNGIKNVFHVSSEFPFSSASIPFSRPADAATYADVVEILMPKILARLQNSIVGFNQPNSVVLKGFNLTDGKIYFEFVNPGGVTRLAQGDMGQWATFKPQNYEEIVDFLDNSSHNVLNFSQYAAGTTWESVLADLGDGYWGASDLWNFIAQTTKYIDYSGTYVSNGLFQAVSNYTFVKVLGLNLNDGKVYFEYKAYADTRIRVGSLSYARWESFHPKDEGDLFSFISNPASILYNFTELGIVTWQEVLADLGDDYWDASDLSGWLAAQA